MKRILIDTNAYAALMLGDGRIADELSRYEEILLSPIVIGELYDGFPGGTRNHKNREILTRFMDKPRTICIPITRSSADWFAEIKRMLKKKGKPIPINDIWIAASCMEHGAHLLSNDRHFTEIDGLLRVQLVE